MTRTIEAVYEGGIFRPLETVPLPEHALVRIVIEAPANGPRITKILESTFSLGAVGSLGRDEIYEDRG